MYLNRKTHARAQLENSIRNHNTVTSQIYLGTCDLSPCSDENVIKNDPQTGVRLEDVCTVLDSNPSLETFINGLKLRVARQVARQLEIKQSVNGTDKTLAQFKKDIRQKLIQSPDLFEQVYSMQPV